MANLLHVRRADKYRHLTLCGRRVYSFTGATAWTTDDKTTATCPKCYEAANGAPIPDALRRPKAAEPTTHCQVCARPVLANSGRIAHHGYKRPAQGWQTASCFGARYRPYEVASDALPLVIEQVERFVAAQLAHAADLVANPPASFLKTEKLVWDSARRGYFDKTVKLDRPAEFNPSDVLKFVQHPEPTGYGKAFRNAHGEALAQARAGREQLKWFRDRLAAWVQS